MSNSPNSSTVPHATPLRPVQAFGILTIIVVALVGYLIIGHLLKVEPVFAGILPIFYWFAVKGGAPEAGLSAFVGALGGVANAALFTVPGIDARIMALAGLVVVFTALYFSIINFVPLLFNQSYMLMATVATIPAILVQGQFVGMVGAVALSAVYFGGMIWLLRVFQARRVRRKQTATALSER